MRTNEKRTGGEHGMFMSRKRAMKKLQLSWPNFRHLCILKGIYPQEPKHRTRLGPGNNEKKTFYFTKDIKFLQHEPIIDKFRQIRTNLAKARKARSRKDMKLAFKLRTKRPRYSLHRIVKERYPTPVDALRDLQDSLNLIFLFARLPTMNKFAPALLTMSRRLCIEMLNYCILTRAVRRSFIAMRGLYVQASLSVDGADPVLVTWCMPHQAGAFAPSDVDYSLMGAFVEFAVTHVSCVLRHLFSQHNFAYPPAVDPAVLEDADLAVQAVNLGIGTACAGAESRFRYLAALTFPLRRNQIPASGVESALENIDSEAMDLMKELNPNLAEAIDRENEEHRVRHLFEGRRFFLNREVPKEYLTVLIRSAGGEVSWSPLCGLGHTFPVDDATIDFHVLDRPLTSSSLPTLQIADRRAFVAPQWVVDCVNARRLLPCQDYAPGGDLPPHLSPFQSIREDEKADPAGGQDYQPPEVAYLQGAVSLQEIRAEDARLLREAQELAAVRTVESDAEQEEKEEEKVGQGKLNAAGRKAAKEARKEAARKEAGVQIREGRRMSLEKQKVREDAARNAERHLAELQISKKRQRLYQGLRKKQKAVQGEQQSMKMRRIEGLKLLAQKAVE